MCNIAGYNGTRQAAPILIDMIRKQEGLDSGFYTGIATFHEGNIYYAKAVGDLDHLLATTDAASLPGTMGVIHSRTPGKSLPQGGGPDCWAHPFISEKNGFVDTALVMNGCGGYFKGKFDISPIADSLLAQGYTFPTRLPNAGNVTLPDGTGIHSTDVRCQLTSKHIADGMDAADAVEEAFTQMPGESVALILSLTEPEAIPYARLVMPMHVAFADHGAYMATAPSAIPDDAGEYTLLPTMSSGKIYRNGFTTRNFKNPPATVAPITPQIYHAAYEYLSQVLKEPTMFTATGLSEHLKDLYAPANCTQRATVAYQVINDFYRQGRLNIETRYVPGRCEGTKAPKFFLSLKD